MTIVLRLGGSLAKARTLKDWIDVVARDGGGRVVVVPGGGVFADAVRDAQPVYRYSDRAAHRMALLAMDQYALMLADLAPGFRLCASEGAIRDALAAGAVALWRPSPMVDDAPDLAASWDVTSDSIAAWLARRLGAGRLVLVKSAAAEAPLHAERLAALGLVDPAFPGQVAGAAFTWGYCGPGEQGRLVRELRAQGAAP